MTLFKTTAKIIILMALSAWAGWAYSEHQMRYTSTGMVTIPDGTTNWGKYVRGNFTNLDNRLKALEGQNKKT